MFKVLTWEPELVALKWHSWNQQFWSVVLTAVHYCVTSGTLPCSLPVLQPHAAFPRVILFDVLQKVVFLQICKNIHGGFSKEMKQTTKTERRKLGVIAWVLTFPRGEPYTSISCCSLKKVMLVQLYSFCAYLWMFTSQFSCPTKKTFDKGLRLVP